MSIFCYIFVRIMQVFGLFLLIFLGVVSTRDNSAKELELLSAVDAARYNTDAIAKLESNALSLPGASSLRNGNELILRLLSGTDKKLRNSDNCGPQKSMGGGCIGYYFLGHFISKRFFLIYEAFEEGGNFILINDYTGYQYSFEDLPRFSPGGGHVLILKDSDLADSEGIEIWGRHGQQIQLEYSGSPSDPGANTRTYYYLDRWRSEGQINLHAEIFIGASKTPVIKVVQLLLGTDGWKTEGER